MCKKFKTIRPPLNHRPVGDTRWADLHIDIVGPLVPSEGMRYLLTILDRTTRWIEAIPMAEATAAACSMMLQSGHLQPAAWPRHLVSTLTEVCSYAAAQQLSRLHQYLSIKTCNCAATFHIQLPGTVM